MKKSEILAQQILNTRKDEEKRWVLEDAYQEARKEEAEKHAKEEARG